MILKKLTVQLVEFWKKNRCTQTAAWKEKLPSSPSIVVEMNLCDPINYDSKALYSVRLLFMSIFLFFFTKLLLSSFVYSYRRECMKDRIVIVSCLFNISFSRGGCLMVAFLSYLFIISVYPNFFLCSWIIGVNPNRQSFTMRF